jgi:hypothetical protein
MWTRRAKTAAVLVAGALAATGFTGASAQTLHGQTSAASIVTVVAVGDIACPPGKPMTRTTCRQSKTANAALALKPTRVLALGDLQYEKGRYRGFVRSYDKSWGQLRAITWPVPGNHEYYTAGASGYYRYFAGVQPGAPGYYRRTLNGWQLYFLNSNCTVVDCAAEAAWLDQEMTANPSVCSLVAFHHPRFSSGEHGNNKGMRRFWSIADAHGADLALSGHDHDYERFAPMNAAGQPSATGIRQFVSGGGGKSLYPRQTYPAGSQVFRKRFGVLELGLGATGYTWKFRTPNLVVRDSGSALCGT